MRLATSRRTFCGRRCLSRKYRIRTVAMKKTATYELNVMAAAGKRVPGVDV